jgi:hypothetical protein
MNRLSIRGWSASVDCGKAAVNVYYVIPDTFFDMTLFTCLSCGALFGVDRERERYSGNSFATLRKHLTCPEASEHLAEYATSMLGHGVDAELVTVGSQAQLTSLQAAVGTAIESGVPYNELINVGGWELKFGAARAGGQLPALVHAMPF